MIELIISNSESKILGLSIKEYNQLKELMSYSISPQARYFSKSFGSGKKTLLTKRGEFPTGLLYIVKEYISKMQNKITDARIKPQIRPGDLKLSLLHTTYQDQTNAARACLNAHRGIISAPTGSGKSVIISLIINGLQVPTLVVVPSLELKRQLSQSLSEAFGVDKVGKGRHIWVENVDALDCTKVITDYDCVIIDEFHHSGAKTYRKLNKKAWQRIYYRFGLTATPFRSQDNERLLLESVLSEVIYKIEHKTAVDKGYIVPAEAYYINIPNTKSKREYSTYSSAYSDLVVNNEERNSIIFGVLYRLTKVLCLVKEISHGNKLTLKGISNFVSGQNDERHLIKAFNDGTIDRLIGTSGVLGEGVDTKPCEFVIIASPVKSKNLFMQMCGRAFRRHPDKESAKIILLKDNSHKWFKSAFKEQCKILLEEYGIVPTELFLDNSK